MKEKLATIIIVTYNGAEFIEKCVNSVLNQNFKKKEYDILIVDNASSDNTLELIRTKYPELRIIQNKTNLGFGRANNIGIKNSDSKYIVLLNQDSYVDKNWLKELILSLEKNQEYACCGSWEVNYEGKLENKITHSDLNDQMWMGCGSVAFRKKALDEVGIFDSFYFMYFEDVDLSWRLRLNGWKLMLNKNASWFHKGHNRPVNYSDIRLFHSWRSRLYLLLKFASFRQIAKSLFLSQKKDISKNIDLNSNMKYKVNLKKKLFIFKVMFSLIPNILKIIIARNKISRIIKDRAEVDEWIRYLEKQLDVL